MGKMLVSSERARSKPCLRCGYSLRHVMDRAHCSECGLPIWISLNGNDSLGLSNPDWLFTTAFAAAGLGLAAGGWTVLQAARLVGCVGYGHLWTPRPYRIDDGIVCGALWCVFITSGLLLIRHEGRWPERGRSERIFGIAGIVAFAVASPTLWFNFSRLSYRYDWIYQLVSPLLFSLVAMATLLFIGNRLSRGRSRLAERISGWSCVSSLVNLLTAALWVPAVFYHLNYGLLLAAAAGPGPLFVPVLTAQTALSLFATVAYCIAARRFLVERREALRAWTTPD
jgi:hypothetical protein